MYAQVSPKDLEVFTDFVFKECTDDTEAKKRLAALFAVVDSDPSDHKGSLSKDEMIAFVEKVQVCLRVQNSGYCLRAAAGADRDSGEPDISYVIYISYTHIQNIVFALQLVLIEIAESLADGIGPAMEHLVKYYLEHRKASIREIFHEISQ